LCLIEGTRRQPAIVMTTPTRTAAANECRETSHAPSRVVLALGEIGFTEFRVRLLSARGHDVVVARTLPALMRSLNGSRPELLVLSTRFGEPRTPLGTLCDLTRGDSAPTIVIETPLLSTELVLQAFRCGAADVCQESCSDTEFLASVTRGLAWRRSRQSAPTRSTTSTDEIGLTAGRLLSGTSRAIAEVRAYTTKLAAVDTNVLITGETGVGKELVARLLHERSPRARKAFVSLNCAAIPDTLLESELFGYERGAFTDATSPRPGHLQQAHGGTLLFDMSLLAQAKVLRAIETREVTPLGGRAAVPVDIRVIAATNQDLERMTVEGRFRADLYYRLGVAHVRLPALRDRLDDLEPLIACFLTEFNRKYHRALAGFTPEALQCLRGYPWPGNVRELRNLVELAVINVERDLVHTDDLPPHLRARHAYGRDSLMGMTAMTDTDTDTLSPDDRTRLMSALKATKWNKSRAARDLCWSRMTLYRKLAKYQLVNDPLP
jgi:DNA-binding NtrC family response regulator